MEYLIEVLRHCQETLTKLTPLPSMDRSSHWDLLDRIWQSSKQPGTHIPYPEGPCKHWCSGLQSHQHLQVLDQVPWDCIFMCVTHRLPVKASKSWLSMAVGTAWATNMEEIVHLNLRVLLPHPSYAFCLPLPGGYPRAYFQQHFRGCSLGMWIHSTWTPQEWWFLWKSHLSVRFIWCYPCGRNPAKSHKTAICTGTSPLAKFLSLKWYIVEEKNSYICHCLPKHAHTLHLCRQPCYYLMVCRCSMPDLLSWNAHGECLHT